MNIRVEKTDTHEGITVKELLDSGAIEMFMDRRTVAQHGFRLWKLERPIMVRNIDGTNNSERAIIYQVEVNVYYKGHMEMIRMDMCNLGKTEVILGMLWLQAHNLEINWETREIKITRCLPLCGRTILKRKERKSKREKRMVIPEEERIVRWAIDGKEERKRLRRTTEKLKSWFLRNF